MKVFKIIFIKFESLKMTYLPFSSVLMLMVCLFLPKNVWFGRYRRFRVLGLHGRFNLIIVFILGFWGDLPPLHFQMFWLWWCVYISLIVHHLEDMKGLTLEWLVFFFLILIEFESFKMTYPFIFKGYDDNGVFIFI